MQNLKGIAETVSRKKRQRLLFAASRRYFFAKVRFPGAVAAEKGRPLGLDATGAVWPARCLPSKNLLLLDWHID